MDSELGHLYSATGRPSIAPERLLRASLSKLDRPLRQVKLRGLDRVDWFYRLTIAAHNLVRMRRPIPIQAVAA